MQGAGCRLHVVWFRLLKLAALCLTLWHQGCACSLEPSLLSHARVKPPSLDVAGISPRAPSSLGGDAPSFHAALCRTLAKEGTLPPFILPRVTRSLMNGGNAPSFHAPHAR